MEEAKGPASRDTRLSLHHLSAMRLSPIQLVEEAFRAGCQHVCLFVDVPEAVRRRYPVVAQADVDGLQAAMARTGVTVFNVEVFPLSPETDVSAFREAFELARSLGAHQATVHVHWPDPIQASAQLRELAHMADGHGLSLGLEFNSFSSVRTPVQALDLLLQTGTSNLSIVADMLHFVRSGSGVDEAQAIAPYVHYGQLCDGPAAIPAEGRWREAISERLAPGMGDFPLRELIANLPNVRVWEVEVPQKPLLPQGQALSDRIGSLVAAAKHQLGLERRLEE